MASSCPCGCGRKVGFSTRGAAAGVAAMDRMLGAVGRDDVLAAAGRLAYHLRHPGRPVTVGVAAAVEAALDDLGLAPGTADPEAEEWVGLAVLEGWRAGRRVLGTDVTPYPYEKA